MAKAHIQKKSHLLFQINEEVIKRNYTQLNIEVKEIKEVFKLCKQSAKKIQDTSALVLKLKKPSSSSLGKINIAELLKVKNLSDEINSKTKNMLNEILDSEQKSKILKEKLENAKKKLEEKQKIHKENEQKIEEKSSKLCSSPIDDHSVPFISQKSFSYHSKIYSKKTDSSLKLEILSHSSNESSQHKKNNFSWKSDVDCFLYENEANQDKNYDFILRSLKTIEHHQKFSEKNLKLRSKILLKLELEKCVKNARNFIEANLKRNKSLNGFDESKSFTQNKRLSEELLFDIEVKISKLDQEIREVLKQRNGISIDNTLENINCFDTSMIETNELIHKRSSSLNYAKGYRKFVRPVPEIIINEIR